MQIRHLCDIAQSLTAVRDTSEAKREVLTRSKELFAAQRARLCFVDSKSGEVSPTDVLVRID